MRRIEKKKQKYKMPKDIYIEHLINIHNACKCILEKHKELCCNDSISLSDIEFVSSSLDFFVELLLKLI